MSHNTQQKQHPHSVHNLVIVLRRLVAFSASNPTKDQLYPSPTLQIKVFKNSSHFSINWYLPIIVDESRAERVQVQYDGQSTASDTDVIHAAR